MALRVGFAFPSRKIACNFAILVRALPLAYSSESKLARKNAGMDTEDVVPGLGTTAINISPRGPCSRITARNGYGL